MTAKQENPRPGDLSALEDTYRIVGELSARDNIRAYLANRLTDGADVLVIVEESPAGDSGGALTTFAADANVLAPLAHRNLIPIHEGRWLDQGAFALVTDRCAAPTLATLVARGETWSYPRIGTILHELHGLLAWARQQKVVHRTLTLDTIHIEPETDRVLVSFVAQPLARHGLPGADVDARTIASVAWTLITRGRDLPSSPQDSIGIVRPELPRRIVEATDALLHGERVGDTEPPPVPEYIALVATADALIRGEMDAAELQAVIHQEQVLEREAWDTKEREYLQRMQEQDDNIAAERVEMERTLMAEREEMTQTIASERQQLATERAELERAVAEERAELERQATEAREQLTAEQAAHAKELADERARLEQELADERTRLEQEIAEARALLERERAESETALADARALLESDRSTGEQTLAEARAEFEAKMAAQREEFEAAMTAQREELEARMAAEREEFDRTILTERNALEAEKEGLAVFHAAEREAIEAERRSLEELYQAVESDGHIVEAVDDDHDDDDRVAPPLFADISSLAVAQPVIERIPADAEPAETDAGLTRKDAKRSKRASWGIPLSVILLAGITTASAVGIGAARDSDGDRADAPARQDGDRPMATTARRIADPVTPLVLDSAGGNVVTESGASNETPGGEGRTAYTPTTSYAPTEIESRPAPAPREWAPPPASRVARPTGDAPALTGLPRFDTTAQAAPIRDSSRIAAPAEPGRDTAASTPAQTPMLPLPFPFPLPTPVDTAAGRDSTTRSH